MKKAQIKLFESIAVMVVFAFLLVFGVNFYFTIQKTSVQRELARAAELRVFTLAQKTAFLPELDCALTGIQEEACVDKSKLFAFKDVAEADPDLYFPVFGFSTVTIERVYPPDDVTSILLYNNSLEDATSRRKVQFPVLVRDASTDEDAFGYIEVTVFAR